MIAQDDFEGWYVVQTRQHAERRVAEELEHIGIESYLPLEMLERKRNRRIVLDARPFLPRFLFVYMRVKGDFYRVKIARGVDDFLRIDGKPAMVQQHKLDRFRDEIAKRIRKFERSQQPKAAFRAGENVKVIEGAFAGFPGVIDRGAESRKGEEARTFRVLMTLFGRVTPAEIEAAHLESTEPEAAEEVEELAGAA